MLFDTSAKQLFFGRKALKPYVDDEAVKTVLLEKPLPSIYPLKPTISIEAKNIYRLEHIFRKQAFNLKHLSSLVL